MTKLRRFWIRHFAARPGPYQGHNDWMTDLIEWCAVRQENHVIYMSGWHDDITTDSTDQEAK